MKLQPFCPRGVELNIGRGDCTYKGWLRGQWPCVPGSHVNCWAVQMSIALTMSHMEYIRIHSCILAEKNFKKIYWCNYYDLGTKCLWMMLFLSQMSRMEQRACERYWIQVWFGRFYHGLLSLKWQNEVTIDRFRQTCAHVTMRPN